MREGEPKEEIVVGEISSEFKNDIARFKESLVYYDEQIKLGEQRIAEAEAELQQFADNKQVLEYVTESLAHIRDLHEQNLKMREDFKVLIAKYEELDRKYTEIALGAQGDQSN